MRLVLLSYWLSCRGNLTYYAPPYGGGDGGGASWFKGRGQLAVREGPVGLGEATMSTFFTRHTPLFLRQGQTGRKKRLFYIQEQAFLEARGALSTSKKGVVLNAIRNSLVL